MGLDDEAEVPRWRERERVRLGRELFRWCGAVKGQMFPVAREASMNPIDISRRFPNYWRLTATVRFWSCGVGGADPVEVDQGR